MIVLPFQLLGIPYNRGNRSKVTTIIAAPYLFWDRVLFRGGWDRYMIYTVSTLPSNHIRKLLYKCLGAKIDKDVVFHFKTEIRSPARLTVGEGTIIGDNCILDARSYLELGKNVNVSSNVSIYTLQHDYRDPEFSAKLGNQKVIIGDRVWLGSNIIVLPGVSIGDGAVVCAGSVVTKDVEPFSVNAGIPAKRIGTRPTNLIYEFKGKTSRLI